MTPGQSLAARLQIRPRSLLWFQPVEWLFLLGPLPAGVTVTGEFAAANVAVLFVSNLASVQWFFRRYGTVAATPAFLWLCYPTRGRTDFNRDLLIRTAGGHGMHPTVETPIDAAWSALRFGPAVRR